MRRRDADFIDPELRMPFVRMHIHNTRNEANNQMAITRNNQLVARIIQERCGRTKIDGVVKDVRRDVSQYLLIASLK
jgi:hypothetical protein